MYDIHMGVPEMEELWNDLVDKKDITIIGLEPHPDDKSNAYKKIRLSNMNKYF